MIGGANSPLGSLFSRVTAWVDEQRRYRRTVEELSYLTERELADIGLSRSDIDLVARNCAAGRS
jgi:uncharacterized protein YjiS (DUF1127 family)